jgi:chromosome partitioning protein
LRIISFTNEKGGVGKTTCTLNLGAALTKIGKKCLLVDLDQQMALTYSFGIPPDQVKTTIYEVLRGEAKLDAAMWQRPSTDLFAVPASPKLAGFDVEMVNEVGSQVLLKEILSGVNYFDYILFDCPPSLSMIVVNALTAAREVFVPMQAEFLSMQGMARLLEIVERVKQRLNRNLEITGIIGTMYDQRRILNREVIAKVEEHFPGKIIGVIRDCISLAEAPSRGWDVLAYRPDSLGAQDFMALAQRVVQMEVNYGA